MKKICPFIFLLASVGILLLLSFVNPTADHSAAQATQEQGYYIFIISKPVTPFEYLGTIQLNNWSTYSGSPKELLNKTIKKTKADYPKADAIIFSDMEMHKADCIKFKE